MVARAIRPSKDKLYAQAQAAIEDLRCDVDFFQRYQYIAELPSTFEPESDEAVLRAVCRFLLGLNADHSAWVYGVDHDRRLVYVVASGGPLGRPAVEHLTIGAATTMGGCVQHATARLIVDCTAEQGYPRSDEEPTTGSVICVPIVADATCAGAILYHAQTSGSFASRDLEQLRSLATVAGVTISAIRQRKHAEWLATHDELTTLLNRRGVESECERIEAADGEVRVVLFMDIDKFKAINSSHLHAGADQVLREVALRFQTACGASATVGRWGGDEMIAIVSLAEANAVRMAEQIVESFRSAPTVGGTITVTIGGTIWKAGESLLVAANRADTAMMRGKEAGRDRAEFET